MTTTRELSKAFAIFDKYVPDAHSVCSEHDMIYVNSVPPKDMRLDDVETLNNCHAFWDEDDDVWIIYP